jgi:hypothetical protein
MFSFNFSKKYYIYIILGLVVLAGLGIYIFKPKTEPTTWILPVPFSAQAPTNNWSRNEDCEETSIAMADSFLNGDTEDRLPATVVQATINNLKTWEQANLGYNANTGVDATTKMAEGTFGLKVIQIPNFTEANLKTELINDHPILLPINAKLLESAQYANNGPTYHMIVIRGFNGDNFIVNDPGTDSGDGQTYSFTILQQASADWDNAKKAMDPSRKFALIVSK